MLAFIHSSIIPFHNSKNCKMWLDFCGILLILTKEFIFGWVLEASRVATCWLRFHNHRSDRWPLQRASACVTRAIDGGVSCWAAELVAFHLANRSQVSWEGGGFQKECKRGILVKLSLQHLFAE